MTLLLNRQKPIQASWTSEAREKIRRYTAALRRAEQARRNTELARKWLEAK